LPLAPDAVAVLVATGHEHDRGVSGPLVLLETAQDLVAVALRHHDVEEKDVRELRRQLVFETLTIGVRDDLVAGGPQDRLHHLEIGMRVVHDHHFAHASAGLPSRSWMRTGTTGIARKVGSPRRSKIARRRCRQGRSGARALGAAVSGTTAPDTRERGRRWQV